MKKEFLIRSENKKKLIVITVINVALIMMAVESYFSWLARNNARRTLLSMAMSMALVVELIFFVFFFLFSDYAIIDREKITNRLFFKNKWKSYWKDIDDIVLREVRNTVLAEIKTIYGENYQLSCDARMIRKIRRYYKGKITNYYSYEVF